MVRKAFTLAATTVLSVSLLSGAAMAAGPKFSAGADGLGDSYYPKDGNGGYDVGHYGLDLRYDPATDRLWVTGKFWPRLFQIRVVSR